MPSNSGGETNGTAVISNGNSSLKTELNIELDSKGQNHEACWAQKKEGTSLACGECGNLVKSISGLVVHVRRHLGYKPFSCLHCSFAGFDEDEVKRHASKSHISIGFGPKISPVKLSPDPEMERSVEMIIAKSQESPAPPLPAESSPPVEDRDHSSSHTDTSIGSGDSLKCSLCGGEVPALLGPLIQHVKAHFSFGGYPCPSCNSVRLKWTDFLAHIKEEHSGENGNEDASLTSVSRSTFWFGLTKLAESAFSSRERPRLPCSFCGENIPWTVSGLEDHVQKHSGRFPFECSECGSSFADSDSAVAHHLQTHQGQFPIFKYSPDTSFILSLRSETVEQAFPVLNVESLEEEDKEIADGDLTVQIESCGPPSHSLFSPLDYAAAASKKSTVQCLLCSAQISRSKSCLIAHTKVHLGYKPLQCEYCPFRHFAMSKIRRHSAKVHAPLPVKVTYNPLPDIGRQIKQMKLRCFGPSLGGWSHNAMGSSSSPDMAEEEEEEEIELLGEEDEMGLSQVHSSSPLPSGDPSPSQLPINPLTLPLNTIPHPASMSKLLEQLVRGKTGAEISDVPHSKEELHGTASSMSDGSSSQTAPESYDLGGMGKKLCCLCQQYIANNPSSFDNHACKHLDYKPYHCQYCQYQSYIRGKVTRHIQQVHSGLPIKINHRPLPGIKEKIQQIKSRCFPFLTNDGTIIENTTTMVKTQIGTGSAEEISCRLCLSQVLAVEPSMDEHLQTHIQTKYYHCPVCTYQTTYLIRAKQHVHSAHPTNQETRILCCPPDGLKGLQALRVKCFGSEIWSRSQKVLTNGVSEHCQENMDTDVLPVSNGDESEQVEDETNEEPVPPPSTHVDPGARIPCSLCKALISNQPTTIGSHVRNHLTDYKPYQCSYCVFKSAAEVEVKAHISSTHKSVPLKVMYNPERTELSKMQEMCFPNIKGLPVLEISGSSFDHNPHLSYPTSTGPGSTLLKKLICNLCKNTIADNPKSVGIHVKNHLNYKPYRCPFCKYMSCEQSKARRHVEHVHSVSGDMVEIHAEDNIKERIQEMKARCFPSLLSDTNYSAVDSPSDLGTYPSSMYNNNNNNSLNATVSSMSSSEELRCQICKEFLSSESAVDPHVRTHLGKPFKCTHCTSRFWTEEKARYHVETVHPHAAPGIGSLQTDSASDDCNFGSVKAKCFPELGESSRDAMDTSESGMNYLDSVMMGVGGAGRAGKAATAEGKLICRVCDQWVSCNPNSLEVHAKTHLNFKQHQCGYCNYRSCISGKVKRHLDNVHRGQDIKMLSLTALPGGIKQIVSDMRSACFPQIEGDHVHRSKTQVNHLVETLKTRLIEELQEMGDSGDVENSEAAAAMAAASSVGGPVMNHGNTNVNFPRTGSGTPLGMLSNSFDENSMDGDFLDSSSVREVETPSDAGTGKLHCQLCGTYVADNPSSLGLHVRNHLAYKPFSCNLCDYKSCIQAKVKRHLRNVHKCPTDEMTYSPEPDIRLKVMDMKLKCFPKFVEAAESAVSSYGALLGNESVAAEDLVQPTRQGNGGDMSEFLEAMLGGDRAGVNLLAAVNAMTEAVNHEQGGSTSSSDAVPCKLCSKVVQPKSWKTHALSHSSESQWHCSECGFSSYIQETINAHAEQEHNGSSAQPVRFGSHGGSLSGEEISKLETECFPDCANGKMEEEEGLLDGEESDYDEEDEKGINDSETTENCSVGKAGTADGPRYICQLCGQAVSMYASSLYVHVKNHMNYKPYRCHHCDYRSPVKSKVRRHIQNAHENLPMTIDFFPTPGIDNEVSRMKKKCFPDVTSFANQTNDKISCAKCKTDVSDTPLSKSVHAKNHLDSKPYHCGYCNYKSCLKGETRRHVSRQHAGKPMRILFREDEVAGRSALEAAIKESFPTSTDPICLSPPPDSPPPSSVASAQASGSPVLTPSAAELPDLRSGRIKLGPAFREWYCPYCTFASTSKYQVKQHCLTDHPGQKVQVSEVANK